MDPVVRTKKVFTRVYRVNREARYRDVGTSNKKAIAYFSFAGDSW